MQHAWTGRFVGRETLSRVPLLLRPQSMGARRGALACLFRGRERLGPLRCRAPCCRKSGPSPPAAPCPPCPPKLPLLRRSAFVRGSPCSPAGCASTCASMLLPLLTPYLGPWSQSQILSLAPSIRQLLLYLQMVSHFSATFVSSVLPQPQSWANGGTCWCGWRGAGCRMPCTSSTSGLAPRWKPFSPMAVPDSVPEASNGPGAAATCAAIAADAGGSCPRSWGLSKLFRHSSVSAACLRGQAPFLLGC